MRIKSNPFSLNGSGNLVGYFTRSGFKTPSKAPACGGTALQASGKCTCSSRRWRDCAFPIGLTLDAYFNFF